MKTKFTATVGDIIAALSQYPEHLPVFAYSYTDECAMPIQAVEFVEPKIEIDSDSGAVYQRTPYGCQADSYVEDHWRMNGDGPVLYLRESSYKDKQTDAITLFV